MRKKLPACCAAVLLASLVSLSGAVADLSITGNASSASVPLGTPFIYTLTVRNTGPDAATDVVLAELLPAVVNLVSTQSDFGSCTQSANTITCRLDSLASGASATLTLTVTPASAGTICNFARVTGSQTDPDLSNNRASVCTTITPPASGADLCVSAVAIPDPISMGANLAYTIRVHNNGPQVATEIRLLDTLPTNAIFVSASPDCVNSGGTVSCTIARLGKGASVTKTIVVAPAAAGQLCNAVSVVGNEPDPRADNNAEYSCALVTATPEPVEDLAVVKLTAPPTVVLTAKKPSLTKLVSVQIQNRSPHNETISGLDKLVTLSVESLGLCPDLVPVLRNGPPQKSLPVTLKPKQTLNVFFQVTFNTNAVNDPLRSSKGDPGHEDYRYRATVHHEAIDGQADTHPSDDTGPRSVTPPFEQVPNPDGKLQDKGVGQLKSDHTFGADILTDLVAPAAGSPPTVPPLTTNRPPVAVDDSSSTTGTAPVQIPVLANDSDPDGDPLTVTSFTQPVNGLVSLAANIATYTANAGFFGADVFAYTISDGRGGSATGHVIVTVSGPANRPPIAVDDSAATSGTTPVQIAILANDSDPDGDPLTVTTLTQPANGFLVSFAANIATYAANAGFSGTDVFAYTISDGRGGTATATVSVTVTNPPPPPPVWETSEIGAVWSDDFNRAALGSNWIVLGGANAAIAANELRLAQTNLNLSRQVYYDPWLTCSDQWTLRWRQRFGALDPNSRGVGVGIKNFQAAGGNDRGYNGLLRGDGTNSGKMQIQRWDGSAQNLAAAGPAMTLAPGEIVDCSLTRSGWTITATASNRANAQVSTASITFSDAAKLIAPTVSRMCFYPLSGTVYVDDVSFTINHRKPARFIIVGASISDGYNASDYAHSYASIIQSNFTETVCNDSSSYNSTSNSISVLAEILAHQPGTAILMIGGNDLLFGYPAAQWQSQYSNLVAQLQAGGVKVKHCLNTPRNGTDLRPLNTWILNHYPAQDVIDTWTPLLRGTYMLNPAYDSRDGLHPNDAGHLLLGQIISSSLR